VRKILPNKHSNSTLNSTYELTGNTNLVKKSPYDSPVGFSKHVSTLGTNISILNPLNLSYKLVTGTQDNKLNTLSLYLKTSNTFPKPINNTTSQEASYVYGTLNTGGGIIYSSTKSLRLNLHTLYKLYNNKNYPLFFDFNTEKNLNNAKQQR